jgi:hypothetical protein
MKNNKNMKLSAYTQETVNTQILKLYKVLILLSIFEHGSKEKEKKEKKNEEGTNKLLLKISSQKLCEMDELKMSPVNIFLP